MLPYGMSKVSLFLYLEQKWLGELPSRFTGVPLHSNSDSAKLGRVEPHF